jgi:general secretion pathway protein D
MASHLTGTPCLRILALAAAALALAGCAAQMAYREGDKLVAGGQVEAGLAKYRQAIAADPGNARYKSAFLKARDGNTTRLVEQAERELASGGRRRRAAQQPARAGDRSATSAPAPACA